MYTKVFAMKNVKSFRLNEQEEKSLNRCFEKLYMPSNVSFTNKMLKLIHSFEDKDDKINHLNKEIQKLEKKIDELKAQLETKVTPPTSLAKSSEPRLVYSPKRPSISKPNTLPKSTQKAKIECRRGIKTHDWKSACNVCKTRFPLDYRECKAPHKH